MIDIPSPRSEAAWGRFYKETEMIPQVETLDEAKAFFLSNASGSVFCVKPDGTSRVCASYPEAQEFFESN